jgi:hypothetical protein
MPDYDDFSLLSLAITTLLFGLQLIYSTIVDIRTSPRRDTSGGSGSRLSSIVKMSINYEGL